MKCYKVRGEIQGKMSQRSVENQESQPRYIITPTLGDNSKTIEVWLKCRGCRKSQ